MAVEREQIYSSRLNKGFRSEIFVDYPDQYALDESRGDKNCDNDDKDEDNSPQVTNDNSSLQKFR